MQEPRSIVQCKTCPWRVGCIPERDIPGYCVDLHVKLAGTCVSGLASLGSERAMACHYSKPGEELPCAGWLYNQIGPGNNINVRLAVAGGELPVPIVDGDQYEQFEDTLPSPPEGLVVARARRHSHKDSRPNRTEEAMKKPSKPQEKSKPQKKSAPQASSRSRMPPTRAVRTMRVYRPLKYGAQAPSSTSNRRMQPQSKCSNSLPAMALSTPATSKSADSSRLQ